VLQLLHQCMHVPDECRTMVSDCLAQLTFMSSAAMAQWLQEQLGSDAATSRGVAVAAVKHVMHDGHYAVPELAQCATALPPLRVAMCYKAGGKSLMHAESLYHILYAVCACVPAAVACGMSLPAQLTQQL
jgi:hypothetical protein